MQQIQCQIYHRAGPLLPPPNEDYKFLQIYFMGDFEQKVEQRCALKSSMRRPKSFVNSLLGKKYTP